MIKGLDNIYYFVSNMDKAVSFYQDTLGLKVLDKGDEWTSLDIGGVRLGLHIAQANEFHKSAEKRAGATVTFYVDDIDEAYKYYKNKGVPFKGDISRNPWGSHVSFMDPDGNILELREGPEDEGVSFKTNIIKMQI